jgi:mono/diheme cytochrome c family protein
MSLRPGLAVLAASFALLACSDQAAPPAPAPAPAPPPAAQPAPAPEPAADASAPSAERGKLQFDNYCVSCHGVRGDGDGPAGLGLDPRPARLGDRDYMSAKTDDYLFDIIKNGGASVGRSNLMAPWGGVLSDAQIRDVIAYVRSLAH